MPLSNRERCMSTSQATKAHQKLGQIEQRCTCMIVPSKPVTLRYRCHLGLHCMGANPGLSNSNGWVTVCALVTEDACVNWPNRGAIEHLLLAPLLLVMHTVGCLGGVVHVTLPELDVLVVIIGIMHATQSNYSPRIVIRLRSATQTTC